MQGNNMLAIAMSSKTRTHKKVCMAQRVTMKNGNMVSLDLSHLEVTALPRGMKHCTSLCQLILYGCKHLKELPADIYGCQSLEKLYLQRCVLLETIPKEIGFLGRLRVLDLSGCDSLETLPPGIGGLTRLTHLYLASCEKLKSLPPEIGRMTRLSKLDLSFCTQLQEIPPEIARLSVSLTSLDLCGCTHLLPLPEEIMHLRRLTYFNIADCPQAFDIPPVTREQLQPDEETLKDICKTVSNMDWAGGACLGAKYTGEVNHDEEPHGWGHLDLTNGTTLEGQFRNGYANGFGVLHNAENGHCYRGMMEENSACGVGVYYRSDKNICMGGFYNGSMHGFGRKILPDGRFFHGSFFANQNDGKGLLSDENGNVTWSMDYSIGAALHEANVMMQNAPLFNAMSDENRKYSFRFEGVGFL